MIENSSLKQYNSHTLWLSICTLEGSTFTTTGRGSRPGTPFSFTVSRNPSSGGRHYAGDSIPGYGNEMWITTADGVKKKSISRSTVDRAYATAVEKGGNVPGPKSLGVPGAGSYLYPVFVRLGVITTDPQPPGADARTEQTDTAE
jgi:hypothetical protein